MLMPGISFETVMDFTWKELSGWHETAVSIYNDMHRTR
jgi:hypothetical protein